MMPIKAQAVTSLQTLRRRVFSGLSFSKGAFMQRSILTVVIFFSAALVFAGCTSPAREDTDAGYTDTGYTDVGQTDVGYPEDASVVIKSCNKIELPDISSRSVWKVVLSSYDGKSIAAMTDKPVFYMSQDWGANWFKRAIANRPAGCDLYVGLGNGSTIAAGCSEGIKVSRDSGFSWKAHFFSDKRVVAITVSGDGQRLAAATNLMDSFFTSDDWGWNWKERRPGFFIKAMASSSSGEVLTALESGGSVYRSNDSGVTWSRLGSSDSYKFSGIASSADGNELAGYKDNGYVYTSQNGGYTWTERKGSGGRKWSSLFLSENGEKLVASGEDFIITSADNGATWSELTLPEKGVYGVAASADGVRLAAGFYENAQIGGNIYTSTDMGVSWEKRDNDRSRDWGGSVSVSDSGDKIAVTANDAYGYYSKDRGETWVGIRYPDLQTPSDIFLKLSGDGSTMVFLVKNTEGITGDTVFISHDGGENWTAIKDQSVYMQWID
ncbi:MAG: hypothetical protein WC889_11475, partial [Myxococcota bacterium]